MFTYKEFEDDEEHDINGDYICINEFSLAKSYSSEAKCLQRRHSFKSFKMRNQVWPKTGHFSCVSLSPINKDWCSQVQNTACLTWYERRRKTSETLIHCCFNHMIEKNHKYFWHYSYFYKIYYCEKVCTVGCTVVTYPKSVHDAHMSSFR